MADEIEPTPSNEDVLNDITQSPTPVKVLDVQHFEDFEDKLTFGQAVQAMVDGSKVTKIEWEDKEYYGHVTGDLLKLRKPDGKDYDWIISRGDIAGTDYVIIG